MRSPVEVRDEQAAPAAKAVAINQAMAGLELFGGAQSDLPAGQNSTFRLSPEPFFIDQATADYLTELGPHFLAFYKGANTLYRQSALGKAPAFVSAYLDMGKPETVVEYARQNRFKQDLPVVIRPDIIPTEQGYIVTELDAVPGGLGLLAFLSAQYAELGYAPLGGACGLPRAFAAALRGLCPEKADPLAAIVVSDESADYRGEMAWLATAVAPWLRARICHPRDLLFHEDGLSLPAENQAAAGSPSAPGELQQVDIIYRFFELFDLKNIPKIDLILYAIRKEMVAATPPLKAHLEEKALFALFHHPALRSTWRRLLPAKAYDELHSLFPYTWIMDARPLPPHAVIPDLTLNGEPVADFAQLSTATQKDRQFVLKPSGFAPDAWGSRGVLIGHDMPAETWAQEVRAALAAFPQAPRILQVFSKGRKVSVSYYDFPAAAVKRMYGRARLCPSYLVTGEQVTLAGILATVVPLDKKAIHGMVDAVMMPVAVSGAGQAADHTMC